MLRAALIAVFVSVLLSGALASDWVVSVSGGSKKAGAIAAEHGLINAGEVIPDTGLYHFRQPQGHRNKRSLSDLKDLSDRLADHADVDWSDHQNEPLNRVKRSPVPAPPDTRRQSSKDEEKICFINTFATEKKESRRCVFPFSYKGKSYLRCTADHSSNSQEWCATEVEPDGEVVHGQWGDCDPKSISCFLITEPTDEGARPQEPPSRRPPPPPPAQRPARPPPPPRRPPPPLPPGARLPQPPPRSGVPPPPFRLPLQGSGGRFEAPPRGFFDPNRPLPPPPPRRGPQRLPLQGGLPNGLFRGPPGLNGLPPQRPQLVANNNPPKRDLSVNVSALKTQWNDDLWPNMWFLNRGDEGMDMNVEDAWAQGFSGKGVKVTILDDGVETNHPDLKENYDPKASIDLNDHDDDPFPRYDILNSNKHGTRCAGTVAASANNSLCGVGIAYKASIGGVRILDGQILDVLEARALSFNHNYVDIYSASWGPDDNGRTVDGPGYLARNAIREGIEKGRQGKGSIFVWASGNGGKYLDSCNADGYTTSIYTLSVSSASENGRIPWYSEQCSSSLATTYSSGSKRFSERKVVTTDLHGKCTDQHTGTSASSPMAAGIIALALEANPDLTWRDAQHLVVRTARPEGNLKANDWATNGVGRKFSHAFGFGLMDAGAMTRKAKDWETVPPQEKCTTDIPLPEKVIIPPGSEETVSLNAAKCSNINYIEHVQAHIKLRSLSKRGDLSIILRSPSKTISILLAPRPFDDERTGLDDFETWPMMSVHYWGESVSVPAGEEDGNAKWFLFVRNEGDEPATLSGFNMTFYGTEEDPQPNYKEDKKPIKLQQQESAPVSNQDEALVPPKITTFKPKTIDLPLSDLDQSAVLETLADTPAITQEELEGLLRAELEHDAEARIASNIRPVEPQFEPKKEEKSAIFPNVDEILAAEEAFEEEAALFAKVTAEN